VPLFAHDIVCGSALCCLPNTIHPPRPITPLLNMQPLSPTSSSYVRGVMIAKVACFASPSIHLRIYAEDVTHQTSKHRHRLTTSALVYANTPLRPRNRLRAAPSGCGHKSVSNLLTLHRVCVLPVVIIHSRKTCPGDGLLSAVQAIASLRIVAGRGPLLPRSPVFRSN